MKKPPSVEAASFKLKLCRDSRPHTIGYLYSYYNSFFVIVNLPPDAKPPPAPQCRDRYPQLKHTRKFDSCKSKKTLKAA